MRKIISEKIQESKIKKSPDQNSDSAKSLWLGIFFEIFYRELETELLSERLEANPSTSIVPVCNTNALSPFPRYKIFRHTVRHFCHQLWNARISKFENF